MSRRRRHQSRGPRFPLVVVVFGGVLLVAAAIIFAVRGGDGGGTPALAVDQEVIDYGDVKLDTQLTFSVTLTNAGDGVLRIREDPYIEVVEGC